MEKSSRQVPSNKEWLKNKQYCDIFYSYLQVISSWDGEKNHCRIVAKKDLNFSNISKILQISRQTLKKRFDWLVSMGLIEINEDGSANLLILENDLATLVPITTLRIMTNTLSERCISIFVYLYNRYYASKQEFICTYEQLKNVIGISSATRSNDYIIKDILFLLEKLELVKTRKESTEDQFGGFKTVLYITKVQNEISDAKDIEIKF